MRQQAKCDGHDAAVFLCGHKNMRAERIVSMSVPRAYFFITMEEETT